VKKHMFIGVIALCSLNSYAAEKHDPTARLAGGGGVNLQSQFKKAKVQKNEINVDMIVTSPKGNYVMVRDKIHKVGDYVGSNKIAKIEPVYIETSGSFANAKNVLFQSVYQSTSRGEG
jgi:hypothetical protein